jgi:hypothetical protein
MQTSNLSINQTSKLAGKGTSKGGASMKTGKKAGKQTNKLRRK